MRALCAAIALLLVAANTAAAQENAPAVNANADHRAIAVRIAEEFAVPRYRALETAFRSQDQSWIAFCAAPADAGANTLVARFADAVSAWAAAEPIRYGPVSENFRYERIAYWPERKNDVARGMTRMLADSDPLSAETIYGKSVAVQGLSGLERLLHEQDARSALLAGDDGAKRRCAAGQAIAGNLVRVAAEIAEGWRMQLDRLRNADAALAREAVTRFGTDLLTVYQVTGDLKMDAPMGKTIDEAKPKSAQYWRSGLSNRTLALNLAAAADLTRIVLGKDESSGSFDAAVSAARLAERLPAPLPDLVADAHGRRSMLLLRDAIRGARDLSAVAVPAALGITVGFNSLDGD